MDFFERQDRARRNTRFLFVYFFAGVVLLILSVYLAVALLYVGFGETDSRRGDYGYGRNEISTRSLWNPTLFIGVSLGTLAVIGIGSLSKMAELSRGGKSVATMLGGRPVQPQTADPEERKLLNVVEEMALASGVPVPGIYILDQERGINAFAAGHTTSDAVVGVTRGAVRTLTRDELQGVIAHEFSHILNGDMRLNLRLIGLIFGILCIAVSGRVLLRVRSSGKNKNPLPALGLALILIGWIGVFFGRLIQAAVSRQREFLADAAAVQFTRNPPGLAGALKKIAGYSAGSRIKSAHAQEAGHLFFGNGLGGSFLNLLATHPPLEERIRLLDPAFDGKLPRIEAGANWSTLDAAQGASQLSGAQYPPVAPGRGRPGKPPPVPVASVVQSIGNPGARHLSFASAVREAFTPNTLAAAHEPLGACTIVYGFLLSTDPATSERQLAQLTNGTSDSIVQETLKLLPDVRQVALHAKLPLIDLCLPALRQLSPSQFEQFRATVTALVECDGEINLFEYMLQRIVLRHLEPQFQPARKPVIQFYSLRPLATDCAVILSALAWVGQDEPGQVQRAFRDGAERLAYAAQTDLVLVPVDHCGLAQVDTSLERLAQAVPQIRKNLLHACALTVAADGLVRESEAEMLRAVADSLDCPIPPLIPGRQDAVQAVEPAIT
jgi:Zn-dependent protease with chaperone function